MYHLTKNLRFESAHRLGKGYSGKCQNIHGHSWNGHISVSVDDLDQYDMGVDFKDLGTFCKMIEGILDHKLLVLAEDQELISLCVKEGWAHVVFEKNPTCETIAAWIHAKAVDFYSAWPKVKVDSVTIEETCTTSCTYKP